ncbi:hypothetical protein GE21DRAFT_1335270 [Neurospora crassa]|nr:hypothetical protein GE21DRAFT_1335270 [Neurospora crassa]
MTAHNQGEGGAPPPLTQTSPSPSNADKPPAKLYHEHRGEPLEGAALQECIEALIHGWTTCVDELSQLHTKAESASKPIRGLYTLLKVQQRTLDKVKAKKASQPSPPPPPSTDDHGTEPKPLFTPAQYFGMRSCCWDDRWSVIKKCRGLVAINKEFARSPKQPVPAGKGWLAYKDNPLLERPIVVDAVIDSGATWLKFVSISPKTLAYQIAVDGWETDEEEEDDDPAYSDDEKDQYNENGNGVAGRNGVQEALGNTEFAESIKKVILAARWNHCHHIHLLLPGLRDGESEPVDRMLRYIREKIGGDDVSVTVSCANSPLLADTPPPPLDTALAALIDKRDPLVADDCGRITSTANLDPSVLVSLVTDLHHGLVELQPEFQQRVVARSVLDHTTDSNELVPREDILAKVLYPALRGRKLVTTRLAAQYFRQLIASIATHSEEVRASFILPPDAPPALLSPEGSSEPLSTASLTPEQRRAEMQRWSAVPIPDDLHLPVEIVDDIELEQVSPLIAEGKLPPMALGVAQDLSRLNRSVYLYGWVNRLTTITGHRGIERQIYLSLATHWTPPATDDYRASESEARNNEIPPDIWHRHLGGYLIHRDKPRDWKALIAEYEECKDGKIPSEVQRWTNPWTTWGRGISTYGLPDTKTWEGVGHADKQSFGRKLQTREARGQRNPGGRDVDDQEGEEQDMDEEEEEEEEEQS